MADTIVSFGVERLWELVSQECERLKGVKEQITELKTDLEILMSFLSDADARKQTSAVARKCVDEVKEITYDAEDIIENYLLKGERSKSSGVKNHMKSLACIPLVRRETALEITSISKRISKVNQVMRDFGIQSNIIEGGYSQALHDKNRETRHTFSSESESNLVGLEKNVEKLVGDLLDNDSNHGISITGLGGLGKTTLARQVFNHDKVKRHFDGLAWVCVSQDFSRKDLWQTILWNLSPGDKDPEMKEDEIQKKLVQLLETKKALIVFDDIWTENAWDRIKPMFPQRKAGWKILLTSRNDAIHPQCVTFKPELLNPDECWILLQMIAFPKNNDTTGVGHKLDEEMVKMAKEMIKHCGGLPLAVKVLGGLLAAQHTSHQWKIISENIKSHIVGGTSSNDDSSSVNHVLSLSFEGLPSYLKHCILHLASYPEDHKIFLEKLGYFWAAEGITKPRHYEGATLDDVADLYIEELVKRNMVISQRNVLSSRFEVCQLHDLMREICLLKAKEENFVQIITDPACSSHVQSQASSKSRRIVVYSTKTFNGGKIRNSKLRSLWFIQDMIESYPTKSYFKELQLLRVLDLSGASFSGRKLSSNIGKLIHLKYLSLHRAFVSHLPSSLRNLKSLLYLNLDVVSVDPIYVPNVLKEMKELRYLWLPKETNDKTKLELGNLLKLEMLYCFSTKDSSVTDLYRMTKLRNLAIIVNGDRSTTETLSSSLTELRHLISLSVSSSPSGFRRAEKTTIDDYNEEGFVLDCVHLKLLKLSICMSRLPDEQHFPNHLTIISLEGCRLVEDPMPILEKLLQLIKVCLMYKSFCGSRMVCPGDGFPKLQELVLCDLDEWEEWIVEEGSMPLLQFLRIENCPRLKELPDGLKIITSLKTLIIVTEKREFKEKVSKGGEDYYKIQHIPHFSLCLLKLARPSLLK